MLTVTLLVAGVCALGMAAAVAGMRRGSALSLAVGAGSGVVAVVVSVALAHVLPGVGERVAAAVATGAAPVAALLFQLLRHEDRAIRPVIAATAIWAAVVVPLAIAVPLAVARSCPPASCVVEDFGGALPYTIALGAFLLVPSAAIPTVRAPGGGRIARIPLVAVVWGLFVVWLAALELDVDRYTPLIAAAAVIAPVVAAITWTLTDLIRGLRSSVVRSIALGLVAGMASMLSSVVAVATPWALLVGAVAGLAGALAFDARALRAGPITLRLGVAAIVIGVVGMLVPGILGTTLGFVFAARVDVLGTQLLAVLGIAVMALVASVPAAILLRRGARSGSRWAIPDSN